MGLLLAFKAFIKAWKEPDKGELFLTEDNKKQKQEEKLLTKAPQSDISHLRLLARLQKGARLIDFLKEDLSSYDDEQIGAAVRQIHQDSAKVLEELVTLRPIRDEEEGSAVQVPVGYDATAIKVIGNVKGEPPYVGTLVHKGWRASKRSLPKASMEEGSEIVAPAEVEIK